MDQADNESECLKKKESPPIPKEIIPKPRGNGNGQGRAMISDIKYNVIKKLGEGTYGRVFLCDKMKYRRIKCKKTIETNNNNNNFSFIDKNGHSVNSSDENGNINMAMAKYQLLNKCVLKEMKRFSDDEAGLQPTMIREVSILNKLKCHYNIVSILNQFVSLMDAFYVEFECCKMDLSNYMRLNYYSKGKTMSNKIIRKFSYQLLDGVSYMHSCRILHRDLKPQNLLIDRFDNLKIADLGLAKEIGFEDDKPYQMLTQEVVTLWYRAPELLLGCETYDGGIDTWSVGCIIAEMARNGLPLFQSDCEIVALMGIFRVLGTPSNEIWPGVTQLKFFNGQPFPQWKARSLHNKYDLPLFYHGNDYIGSNVVSQFLMLDPKQRSTAKSILEKHPWFEKERQTNHYLTKEDTIDKKNKMQERKEQFKKELAKKRKITKSRIAINNEKHESFGHSASKNGGKNSTNANIDRRNLRQMLKQESEIKKREKRLSSMSKVKRNKDESLNNNSNVSPNRMVRMSSKRGRNIKVSNMGVSKSRFGGSGHTLSQIQFQRQMERNRKNKMVNSSNDDHNNNNNNSNSMKRIRNNNEQRENGESIKRQNGQDDDEMSNSVNHNNDNNNNKNSSDNNNENNNGNSGMIMNNSLNSSMVSNGSSCHASDMYGIFDKRFNIANRRATPYYNNHYKDGSNRVGNCSMKENGHNNNNSNNGNNSNNSNNSNNNSRMEIGRDMCGRVHIGKAGQRHSLSRKTGGSGRFEQNDNNNNNTNNNNDGMNGEDSTEIEESGSDIEESENYNKNKEEEFAESDIDIDVNNKPNGTMSKSSVRKQLKDKPLAADGNANGNP